MIQNRHVTKEQALQKLKHYCAYQERSHLEVKEKLYSLGQWKQDVENIIAQLIEEGYLNEERFAIQFAGGKFRMKHWGKKKIEQALKEKQVSAYCIKKALKEIPEADYLLTLAKQATTKWQDLKGEKNIFIKKRKLQDYLIRKGFEYDLIREQIGECSRIGER
ncbi:MAG: RecX family transcriptional regulator [Chitinophagaceae bacterium]|nr:RecX family transcriptional regulator [Chitinophagaceae bacterium]